jgi:hypothetical protein
MVNQGQLRVEAIVTIEEVNQFPTGQNEWEIQTTKKEVLFEVHRFNVGEIFGL